MASIEIRGTGGATAGSMIRAVALPPGRLGKLTQIIRALPWRAWARPAARVALLVASLAVLAWIGTREELPGWPSTARAASSAPPRDRLLVLRGDAGAPDGSSHEPTPTASASASASGAAPGVLADGRVVLNAASEEQLQKLPRVGASRARAIVALRQKLGRFRSPRDLLRVKGIGPRTLQKMQPHLVVDAPADAGS